MFTAADCSTTMPLFLSCPMEHTAASSAHDSDKSGINKDDATTLIPVPPNKPKACRSQSAGAE